MRCLFKGSKKLIGHTILSRICPISMKFREKNITHLLKVITLNIMLLNSVLNNAKYHSRASVVSREGRWIERILVSVWSKYQSLYQRCPESTGCEIKLSSTNGVMTAVSLSGENQPTMPSPSSSCFFCMFVFALFGKLQYQQAQSFETLFILFSILEPS